MKNFLRRRRAATDPTRFQGWGRTNHYFEGWYFKVVVAEQNIAYAFIPGISYGIDGTNHSFLQVLDGFAATSAYHEYTTEQFQADPDRFELKLAGHFFSADRLLIDLPDLQLDLTFEAVTPWPASRSAPGVMGWYGYVPGMQCYHGLVSFHHGILGSIRVGDQLFDATGGIGYTEKDWGKGFPDAWIWTQSNHLSNTDAPASLMASVASIPWLGSSFTGFLCTLLLDGELYTFTTWTGARVQVNFHETTEAVRLVFFDKTRSLTLTGHPAAGGHLASPIAGAMTGKINESLRGEVEVLLEEHGTLVYSGTASWAGLEVSEGARTILG